MDQLKSDLVAAIGRPLTYSDHMDLKDLPNLTGSTQDPITLPCELAGVQSAIPGVTNDRANLTLLTNAGCPDVVRHMLDGGGAKGVKSLLVGPGAIVPLHREHCRKIVKAMVVTKLAADQLMEARFSEDSEGRNPDLFGHLDLLHQLEIQGLRALLPLKDTHCLMTRKSMVGFASLTNSAQKQVVENLLRLLGSREYLRVLHNPMLALNYVMTQVMIPRQLVAALPVKGVENLQALSSTGRQMMQLEMGVLLTAVTKASEAASHRRRKYFSDLAVLAPVRVKGTDALTTKHPLPQYLSSVRSSLPLLREVANAGKKSGTMFRLHQIGTHQAWRRELWKHYWIRLQQRLLDYLEEHCPELIPAFVAAGLLVKANGTLSLPAVDIVVEGITIWRVQPLGEDSVAEYLQAACTLIGYLHPGVHVSLLGNRTLQGQPVAPVRAVLAPVALDPIDGITLAQTTSLARILLDEQPGLKIVPFLGARTNVDSDELPEAAMLSKAAIFNMSRGQHDGEFHLQTPGVFASYDSLVKEGKESWEDQPRLTRLALRPPHQTGCNHVRNPVTGHLRFRAIRNQSVPANWVDGDPYQAGQPAPVDCWRTSLNHDSDDEDKELEKEGDCQAAPFMTEAEWANPVGQFYRELPGATACIHSTIKGGYKATVGHQNERLRTRVPSTYQFQGAPVQLQNRLLHLGWGDSIIHARTHFPALYMEYQHVVHTPGAFAEHLCSSEVPATHFELAEAGVDQNDPFVLAMELPAPAGAFQWLEPVGAGGALAPLAYDQPVLARTMFPWRLLPVEADVLAALAAVTPELKTVVVQGLLDHPAAQVWWPLHLGTALHRVSLGSVTDLTKKIAKDLDQQTTQYLATVSRDAPGKNPRHLQDSWTSLDGIDAIDALHEIAEAEDSKLDELFRLTRPGQKLLGPTGKRSHRLYPNARVVTESLVSLKAGTPYSEKLSFLLAQDEVSHFIAETRVARSLQANSVF